MRILNTAFKNSFIILKQILSKKLAHFWHNTLIKTEFSWTKVRLNLILREAITSRNIIWALLIVEKNFYTHE